MAFVAITMGLGTAGSPTQSYTSSLSGADARMLDFLDDLRFRQYPGQGLGGADFTRLEVGQEFVDRLLQGVKDLATRLEQQRLDESKATATPLGS